VVHPTGHGTALVGLGKGFDELASHDLLEGVPPLYAAQAEGCAPVADAWEAGAETPTAVETPDTIVGPLEIPDPAGGRRIVDALAATDGGAVASDDDAILASAVALAETGITAGPSGGAALAGARALADRGAFEGSEVVVLVNPTTGNTEADVLRSHLMSRGI
jgi:threonine synthase